MNPWTHTTRWVATAAAAVAFLATNVEPAAAVPVLSGDVDQLFEVRPDDCPDCVQGQLSELEEGLELALRELRKEVRAEICVAEASLIRDLAVLTFNELRRTGEISNSRWKDFLRAKAEISGGLSEVTKRNLLQRFRESIGASSPAMDYYAAAQYSRVFLAIAQGLWDLDEWLAAMSTDSDVLARHVDSVLTPGSDARHAADRAIALSRPAGAWLEGELWHLTRLPGDFEVGSVPTASATLKHEYAIAIAENRWTAGVAGCGLEAAAGLAELSREGEQGVHYAAVPSYFSSGGETGDSSGGPRDSADCGLDDPCLGGEPPLPDPDSDFPWNPMPGTTEYPPDWVMII